MSCWSTAPPAGKTRELQRLQDVPGSLNASLWNKQVRSNVNNDKNSWSAGLTSARGAFRRVWPQSSELSWRYSNTFTLPPSGSWIKLMLLIVSIGLLIGLFAVNHKSNTNSSVPAAVNNLTSSSIWKSLWSLVVPGGSGRFRVIRVLGGLGLAARPRSGRRSSCSSAAARWTGGWRRRLRPRPRASSCAATTEASWRRPEGR